MLTYKYIPHVITGIFVLIMTGIFIYSIRNSVKKQRAEAKFDKQLAYSMNPEDAIEEKESWLTLKMQELPKSLIKSGLVSNSSTVPEVQRKIMLGMGVLFTGTVFLAGNLFAGIIPAILGYMGLSIYSTMRINKVKRLVEEQIPGFVSTFKANIQASQHPQNAMINAIENTAKPLYDELAVPKAIMEAGEFKPGIVALRKSTENETLRLISSCIELATASGANIENQIDTIEDIIQDRQMIERKKALGVNENKPLFIIAALFVPFSFVGSYFMSDMHRDFWFDSTLSWIILISVIVVMTISILATWKVIQSVENH